MKLDEFKAWFEGFTEGLEGAPTAKQWKRIKERVGEIDGMAISYPVYVDRYWPALGPALPGYWLRPYCGTTAQGVGTSIINNVAYTGAANRVPSPGFTAEVGHLGIPASAQCFDSRAAMYAAGKAEALQ